MRSENSIHRKIPDNNGFQSFYCRVFFSSTKRCTDCFSDKRVWTDNGCCVSITKRCTDCFNLVQMQVRSIIPFQSPNGVQIAYHILHLQYIFFLFQSPNGVQIALITRYNRNIRNSGMFQSPNGVQIAFALPLSYQMSMLVSITKRCTDCFI